MNDSMIFERKEYLSRLIEKRENGLVKVITGVRRSGKSFLLFNLYKKYLINDGVSEDNIISLALDNVFNAVYRDPLALSEFLKNKINDSKKIYYVFLDEIQFVGKKKIQDNPEIYVSFYDVLNSLLQNGNVDIYVTGSNSKMLSNDISTEFRGRGDELHISPLSFSELYEVYGGDKAELLADYMTFGGLPYVNMLKNDFDKKKYLSDLFNETYLKDILERHNILYPETLGMIADELSSAVGSLTNSAKIANTLATHRNIKADSETISIYISYLTDSFLFSKASRYDIKGRKYFSYPNKYYCIDSGLRNARLNFRQMEETHLMENIIYNELCTRNYCVDVGVVDTVETQDGCRKRKTYEIDFVINAGKHGERIYIQSALNTDTQEKVEQELRPFLKLKNDFSKRVIITKTAMKPWVDEYGIIHMGIYDFLLNRTL